MSEKRFIVLPNDVVWDNQLGEVVCRCIIEGIGDAENVCQRLNEQQTEITELRRAIDYLKTVIRYTIPNQMVADVFKYIGEDYE